MGYFNKPKSIFIMKMNKPLLLILMTILSLNCYSQISFENGYFINNSGQKVDCQIKNIDWKNNPIEFEYRLSDDDEIKRATIKTVKEFGVYNISKYSRYIVKIDRSSDIVTRLSKLKSPVFTEEQLFLKVLVQGKANLYSFENGSLRRYFYNKDNSEVEQLIFKKYKITDDKIGTNNRFRQQLWNDLKCPAFKMNKMTTIDYKRKELVNFFVEYNECNNVEIVNFEDNQKKDFFNLTFRPRINSSSLTIQNSSTSFTDTDFENKLSFGFGIEAEFILPFNKNKWAITIEPTYQYFKSEKTTEVNNVSGGKLIANVDYKSIEVPVSLRHYFFLKNKSKIFVNASYVFDISSNSSIEFTRLDGSDISSVEIQTKNNLALGMGYKHNDRYSLELKYLISREVLGDYTYWSSKYNTLSVIFGYTIF